MALSLRETFDRLLGALARAYVKLPVKPFRGVARRLWSRYTSAHRTGIVTRSIDGITYELNLAELIDNSIYHLGCFEPDTTAALKRVCQPGMLVFDVGANIGCHTLPLARATTPGGRVYAFEPMPWAHAKLVRNVSCNSFANITVERLGLSDAGGSASVHFRSSWRITDGPSREDPAATEKTEVRFTTLDAYVESHGLPSVDLIKLDVDGYEGRVLRGARNVLARFHPTIILELGDYTLAAVGDSVRTVASELMAQGYSLYHERTFERIPDMEALVAAIPDQSAINVLAAVRDPREPWTRSS
jgi:FkbM family methyltransferase